jgi:predicted ester cyclase
MAAVPPVLLHYIEGLKAHDVERIAGTVADDLAFVAATRTLNKPQFLAMLRALYAGFPDWHYDHDPVEVRPDCYAVKWRQSGTHLGTWDLPGMDPIPATGKQVRIPEHYFFYKVRDDQIVQIRPDPIPGGAPRGILEQVGVDMPPL